MKRSVRKEATPILVGESSTKKIIDRKSPSMTRRLDIPCALCSLKIDDRFLFSKTSSHGTKHYHIDCAIKVGFQIEFS
ncbi:MAG: hypothetical protein ACYC7D_11680 [Nitrososphaerales archaeon]